MKVLVRYTYMEVCRLDGQKFVKSYPSTIINSGQFKTNCGSDSDYIITMKRKGKTCRRLHVSAFKTVLVRVLNIF